MQEGDLCVLVHLCVVLPAFSCICIFTWKRKPFCSDLRMTYEHEQALDRIFYFLCTRDGDNERKATICTRRPHACKSSLNFICDVCLNTEKVT